jgi:hypothetical protein
VSKESKSKKQLEKYNALRTPSEKPEPRATLTPEQKAQIIRDRWAKRPVIVFRYPNGKLNKRFIYSLAFLVVALVAALIFLAR